MRAERLGRSVARWQAIRADAAAVEVTIEALLAETAGQVLTSLPGVAVIRSARSAAFSLTIERFPSAEHLYSATGLAPARYQSATINPHRPDFAHRPGRTPRRAHGHHLGTVATVRPLIDRDRELRARGMAPIQARVALARHAC